MSRKQKDIGTPVEIVYPEPPPVQEPCTLIIRAEPPVPIKKPEIRKNSILADVRKLKRFLTTNEVMTLTRIKQRDTICKWVREGKLEAKRISNGYRFDPLYIANWIEAREV